MIQRVQDIITKAIKNLYIVSGIGTDLQTDESPVAICESIIDGAFINLCSEFDEMLSDRIRQLKLSTDNFKFEVNQLKSIINKNQTDVWGFMQIRYLPLIEIDKVVSTKLSEITIEEVTDESIFTSTKQDMFRFIHESLFHDVSANMDIFFFRATTVSDLPTAMIYYGIVDKVIITTGDVNTICDYYNQLSLSMDKLVETSKRITNDTYEQLKNHKDVIKRDIVYKYKNGKCRTEDCCDLAGQLILFTAKIFILTEQMLSLYLSMWSLNMITITEKMKTDRYYINEAFDDSKSQEAVNAFKADIIRN